MSNLHRGSSIEGEFHMWILEFEFGVILYVTNLLFAVNLIRQKASHCSQAIQSRGLSLAFRFLCKDFTHYHSPPLMTETENWNPNDCWISRRSKDTANKPWSIALISHGCGWSSETPVAPTKPSTGAPTYLPVFKKTPLKLTAVRKESQHC